MSGAASSLFDQYPEFNFSCDFILPRELAQQYTRVINALEDSYFVVKALQDNLTSIIAMRNPWQWCENSCHLDCWLMVELSYFGHMTAEQNQALLTDDIVMNSPSLRKLFKVLLGTERFRDKYKMWYWAMEIEEYMGGSAVAQRSFGRVTDYSHHGDYFASSLQDRSNLDLRNTHIGLQPKCNNPDHKNIPSTAKSLRAITAVDNWYTLPDAWVREKDENGRWFTSRSHARPHTNIRDVMETVLGRTEGETTECADCAAKLNKSFQITWEKLPSLSTLPMSLEIQVDPDQLVSAEATFVIAGTTYTLLSVVFGNDVHFTCNVMLRDSWYHYDGLGMSIRRDSASQNSGNGMPNVPRLCRAYNYMTAPPSDCSNGTYRAIAYRYFREGATMLVPEKIQEPARLPSDLQFNSTWRLFL